MKESPKHLFITLILYIFFLFVSYPLLFFLEKKLIFNIAMISATSAVISFCLFAILYFRFEMKKSFKNRRPFLTGIILTFLRAGVLTPNAIISHFTYNDALLTFIEIMWLIINAIFWIIIASLIISFLYNRFTILKKKSLKQSLKLKPFILYIFLFYVGYFFVLFLREKIIPRYPFIKPFLKEIAYLICLIIGTILILFPIFSFYDFLKEAIRSRRKKLKSENARKI